jgi:LysR family transcriptional regulator, hydrogen peroxide-inducible genes activator
MSHPPSLRQLRFLVAVVDSLHFGRAANACFVSQSTLSAGIKELEDRLGVAVIERTRRSVAPTAVGREIAARAREILAGADSLVDIARAAQDPMAGPLRLGMIPTIGPFLTPRAMPKLRVAFPRLQLYLREEQSARLVERLDAAELDAAVLALPYPLDGFDTLDLFRDRFWVVCPPGHRFSLADRVSLQDMASENLLLLEEGHCMRDHALAACALEGARRNDAFQGTSLYTLVQMVAGGLGITLLPQMALDAGILRGLDLAALPLEGDAACRTIGLVWRRTSGRKTTFLELAAILKDFAQTG